MTTRISNNVVSEKFQRGLQGQSRQVTGTLNLALQERTVQWHGYDRNGTAGRQPELAEAERDTATQSISTCSTTMSLLVPAPTYLAAYRMVSRGCWRHARCRRAHSLCRTSRASGRIRPMSRIG